MENGLFTKMRRKKREDYLFLFIGEKSMQYRRFGISTQRRSFDARI